MGHEFIGVVEAVGADVRTVKTGDLVVAPFVWSDGTCVFCREGLHTSCLHGGRYGFDGVDGGQGEAVRVPQADGTLVVLPVGQDDALMPSLLTLSDVMATGHHAALAGEVGPGKTVAVVGDGAVGLCGVIAARRLGAEQIIMLGRHPDRIALGAGVRRDRRRQRARRRGGRARARADRRLRRPLRPRVRRPRAVDRHGAEHRPPGRRGRPRRRSAGRDDPRRRCRRSSTTSPSPAARLRRARTSRSCCRTSSKAGSSPAASSTASAASTDVPDGYRAMNDREAIKVMIEF